MLMLTLVLQCSNGGEQAILEPTAPEMIVPAKNISPEPSRPIVDDSPNPLVPQEIRVQEIIHEDAPTLSSPVPSAAPIGDAVVSGLKDSLVKLLSLRCTCVS